MVKAMKVKLRAVRVIEAIKTDDKIKMGDYIKKEVVNQYMDYNEMLKVCTKLASEYNVPLCFVERDYDIVEII